MLVGIPAFWLVSRDVRRAHGITSKDVRARQETSGIISALATLAVVCVVLILWPVALLRRRWAVSQLVKIPLGVVDGIW